LFNQKNGVFVSLNGLTSFGDVAAEDDAVLDYFLKTDAVRRVENGEVFVVLGRKGAGKTALVRHFTEGKERFLSTSLNLRGYPWSVHAQRIDRGASTIEAYVASWRYLIVIEIASLLLGRTERPQYDKVIELHNFFKDNYGGPHPRLADILRPKRLKLGKLSFQPQVMGNQLGGVELDRGEKDLQLGLELDSVSNAIMGNIIEIAKNEGFGAITLHFDELDQGLSHLDEQRELMLVGLVLAARELRREFKASAILVNPVVYLRTDIWDDLEFSDKNKISQSAALNLDWSADSLLDLVNERIKVKVSPNVSWLEVIDSGLMRGSQTKWNHIISRTFLRPRDVIRFLNAALSQAKQRDGDNIVFINPDIVNARDEYSNYLKRELDDEVLPHWEHWGQALQVLSALSTITFEKSSFIDEYERRRTGSNAVNADDALRLLYRFSVIGYERRSGYGGSSWVFQYTDPEAGWDNNTERFKVHLGLKEYAKLREDRL
jgi:hypothetical protein